ncbi:MAG TPA: hypothetical protein VLB69_05570 [Rudaea sp.]|nr:hypothetical protein [Rudaea sp.]
MTAFDQHDWLAQRLDVLKPGWRGRLRLLAPEEARTSAPESLIGTIVDEAIPQHGPDGARMIDAVIIVCANYRRGRFVPLCGEPNFCLHASQIIAMEPM